MTIKRDLYDYDTDLTELDVFGQDVYKFTDFAEDDGEESTLSFLPDDIVRIDPSTLLSPDLVLNGKKLYVATDYKSYEAYIMSNVLYNQEYLATRSVSYDIETNAESPMSVNAKIIGLSNSFSEDSGIYVVRESLDYNMPDSEWNKIVALYVKLMNMSDKIIVHNSQYERPYTINCMGYEIVNEKLEDTLAKCRILYPGEPADLKQASARLLGYADWDTELTTYTKATKNIINILGYVATAKKLKAERKGDHDLYYDLFIRRRVSDPNKLYVDIVSGTYSAGDGMTELVVNLVTVFQIFALNEILTPHILGAFVDRINEHVNNGGLDTSVIPYSMIPMKMLSKYGAFDAIATKELNNYFDKTFEPKSEDVRKTLRQVTESDTFDFFDLRKGYEGLKAQFDAGSNLEMAGVRWDDTTASEVYRWHEDTALTAWYAMFEHPKFAAFIKQNNKDVIYTKILKQAGDDLSSGVQSKVANLYADMLETFGAYTVQKSQIKFLDHVEQSDAMTGKYLTVRHTNFYKQYPELVDQFFNTEFDSLFSELIVRRESTTYIDVKSIYNPLSTMAQTTNVVIDTIITDQLKLAEFYLNCVTLLSANRYWEHVRGADFMPTQNLFRFLENVKVENLERSISGQELVDQAPVFEKFKELLSYVNFAIDTTLSELFITTYNIKPESLSDSVMYGWFNQFIAMGVNPEDEATWTPEYRFLYNVRSYRKAVKIITSFLQGKVGRQSVYVVDKHAAGDLLPKRKRRYDEQDPPYDPATEELLIFSKFGICTARTGRWQSGAHTVPASSTVKNIYRSRYPGGVICSPDYSQMEVRAVAVAAREESMIKIFKENGDIHKNTATSIYRKKPEDVTESERKLSKGATFSIIYGAGEFNLAQNFFAGDILAARDLLTKFYEGYKSVKQWVDAMHHLYKNTGYVALTSSRLIKIKRPEAGSNYGWNEGFRQAQNYPIQGFSNDVAGVALYLIIREFKARNMKSKAFSFVHDALYFDIHPDELFVASNIINEVMNQYPRTEYDLPVAADLALGVSMGEEVKVSNLVMYDDHTGECTIKGYLEDVEALISNWKNLYKIVEVESVGEPKTLYIPRGDLFQPKRTISKFFGTTRYFVTKNVKIKIS